MAFITSVKAASSNSTNAVSAAIDTTGATHFVMFLASYSTVGVSGGGGVIPAPLTISDTYGNGWIQLGTYSDSGSGGGGRIAYAENATGGTGHVFTVSGPGGAVYPSFCLLAFDDIAPFGSCVFYSGTIGSGASTQLTGTASEPIDGCLIITGAASGTTDPGPTGCADALDGSSPFNTHKLVQPLVGSLAFGSAISWWIQPTKATSAPQWTGAGLSAAGVVAVFKPPDVGTGVAPTVVDVQSAGCWDIVNSVNNFQTTPVVLPAFVNDPQVGDWVVVMYSQRGFGAPGLPSDNYGGTYSCLIRGQSNTKLLDNNGSESGTMFIALLIDAGPNFTVTCNPSTGSGVMAWCIRGGWYSNDIVQYTSNVVTGLAAQAGVPVPVGPTRPVALQSLLLAWFQTVDIGYNPTSPNDWNDTAHGWNAVGVNGFTTGMRDRSYAPTDGGGPLQSAYLISDTAQQAHFTNVLNLSGNPRYVGAAISFQPVVFVPLGPPAFTGTVAATLQKMSAAGTGTFTPEAFTGTAVETTQKISEAAVGTETVPAFSGAGAVAPHKITAAGAGVEAQAFSGSGAATLTRMASAGAGVAVGPSFAGSGAPALQKLAEAAAGTETVPAYTGSGAATFKKIGLFAAGTGLVPAFGGIGSPQLQKMHASGTGLAAIQAVIAALLQKIREVSTAVMIPPPIAGSGGAHLQKVQAAGEAFFDPLGNIDALNAIGADPLLADAINCTLVLVANDGQAGPVLVAGDVVVSKSTVISDVVGVVV